LFDAMAHTPELASLHLLVVGDGNLHGELRRRADKLGLASRITFAGARRDLGDLLSCFDVFVLPSLWEGLPLSLILAMGAGVPVVAADVAGMSEIVENGRTGLLVPPGYAHALGSAIVRLVTDPALRDRLTSAARVEIRPRFGIEGYVASITALYDRLLSERAA
jgi:glycosyltransferase involved in cell wall biosynthesis